MSFLLLPLARIIVLLEPQKLKGRLRPNNFCSAGPCDLHTDKYALTSNLEAAHKLVVIFSCLVVTKVHSIKTLYQPLPTEFSDHYIIKQSPAPLDHTQQHAAC